MAFGLKDQEIDSLARQVASLTGETLTEAVRGGRPWDDAVIERFNALPVLDDRTDDKILGYDDNGLPY